MVTSRPWMRQFDCLHCEANLTFSINDVPEEVLNYESNEFIAILNFEKLITIRLDWGNTSLNQ